MKQRDYLIVYHGNRNVVKYPEICIKKYYQDFYSGFYCLRSEESAVRWAKRYGKIGYVSIYQYAPLDSLQIKTFSAMTDEWLEFITSCRQGQSHGYDIVEGPMVDDTIFNFVQDIITGNISREAFWALVKTKNPIHQISFHTTCALETLKFVGGKEVAAYEE